MYEFRNYSGVKVENEIILEVLLTIRDKMGIGLLSNYGKFLLSHVLSNSGGLLEENVGVIG
ncbi:hypothetical protein DRO29_07870 [Candidatus Bathyarchaeota archaeon]|nr:MAG: hypothetical protein DRO29_07870 [Candidatus Bathyarchaeota archaeon]